MVDESCPGIRPCSTCGWLFVSLDVERMRRCKRCKRRKADIEPRRATLHIDSMSESLRFELGGNNKFT